MEFREEGFAAGAVEYFTKPFKQGQLATFIKTLFEMRKMKRDGRMLVVENDASARHIFSYFLQKNGYTVQGAPNGEDAIAAIGSFGPDLVVTDSRLPGMTGAELTRRIKGEEKTQSVPVIMVTASKEKKEAIQGLAAGAVDYIVKPFDESEMMARLETHIRNKRLMEQVLREKEKLESALGQLEEANRMLERLAVVDGLTGLSNRRHFDEVIKAEWGRAWREKKPLSFIILDIDHFKKFNDGYGHQAGDECITKTAGAIKGCVKRIADLPARYGGEEFAVVLPNTDAAGARQVGEKIRAAVEALGMPHQYSGTAPFVTVSVGHSTLDPGQTTGPAECKELIQMADKALYASKHAGRNRVTGAGPFEPDAEAAGHAPAPAAG